MIRRRNRSDDSMWPQSYLSRLLRSFAVSTCTIGFGIICLNGGMSVALTPPDRLPLVQPREYWNVCAFNSTAQNASTATMKTLFILTFTDLLSNARAYHSRNFAVSMIKSVEGCTLYIPDATRLRSVREISGGNTSNQIKIIDMIPHVDSFVKGLRGRLETMRTQIGWKSFEDVHFEVGAISFYWKLIQWKCNW